jgi:DNA-binding response OmpR family regulator
LKDIKSVLIISSDPDLKSRLARMLCGQEYKVYYALRSDQELQQKIERIDPRLIIVDPEIPVLKGIALSLLIRQWSPAPILMLSAVCTQPNEIRMLDMNAEEYLSEPFDVRLFSVRIDNILSPSPAV